MTQEEARAAYEAMAIKMKKCYTEQEFLNTNEELKKLNKEFPIWDLPNNPITNSIGESFDMVISGIEMYSEEID